LKKAVVFFITITIFAGSATISYAAGNKERYVERNNFSIAIPESWEVVSIRGLKYKILRGAFENNFSPTINFVDEEFDGELDEYIEYFMDQIDSIFVENREYIFYGEFKTLKELTGRILVITSFQQGMLIQFNYFLFPRNDGRYIIITCSNLANDNLNFNELYINTVRTFELLR
jgi:hypothetical protein